jgi:L-serine deaminase|tara:strand:+ start:600 stop:845 length:246 start_codon:yes stop_codon:yes gene_type:complete
MDAVWLTGKLLKAMKEREEQIAGILINNELSSMEQYRTLMGEVAALGRISQEMKSIIEKGIDADDNGTILTRAPSEEKSES